LIADILVVTFKKNYAYNTGVMSNTHTFTVQTPLSEGEIARAKVAVRLLDLMSFCQLQAMGGNADYQSKINDMVFHDLPTIVENSLGHDTGELPKSSGSSEVLAKRLSGHSGFVAGRTIEGDQYGAGEILLEKLQDAESIECLHSLAFVPDDDDRDMTGQDSCDGSTPMADMPRHEY